MSACRVLWKGVSVCARPAGAHAQQRPPWQRTEVICRDVATSFIIVIFCTASSICLMIQRTAHLTATTNACHVVKPGWLCLPRVQTNHIVLNARKEPIFAALAELTAVAANPGIVPTKVICDPSLSIFSKSILQQDLIFCHSVQLPFMPKNCHAAQRARAVPRV